MKRTTRAVRSTWVRRRGVRSRSRAFSVPLRPLCGEKQIITEGTEGTELKTLIGVLAERAFQRGHDLADGAVVAHAVDDRGHEVFPFAGGAVERIERAAHVSLACLSELLKTRELIALHALVDRQDRQG